MEDFKRKTDLDLFYKRQRKQAGGLVKSYETCRKNRFTESEIKGLVRTSFIGISPEDVIFSMGRVSGTGKFYALGDVLRGVENALENLRVKY